MKGFNAFYIESDKFPPYARANTQNQTKCESSESSKLIFTKRKHTNGAKNKKKNNNNYDEYN